MKIIRDTNLNVLADSLIDDVLNAGADFFSYATIVVPNRNVRQWFKAHWLNTKKEIMMNINFVSLDDYLFSIFDTSLSLAGSSDIKSIFIKLIGQNDFDHTYPKIRNYLFDDVNNAKVLNHSKLYELAATLTSLFSEYEKEELEIKDWQKNLYDSLMTELEKYNLITLAKLFKDFPMKTNTEKVRLFGFLSLDKLYKSILEKHSRDSEIALYQLDLNEKKDVNYQISSSPSISKEIEVLHSIICDLLKKPENKPTDFLVVGKGMSEYENVIKKTFNQDDQEFPYIPYSISGSKSEDSDLTIALKLLIEIVNKGFFTRLDFFTLAGNKLIMNVRNITDDQIEQWMDSIHTLNVYRGNVSDNDDWDYIRKRMLLSKISDVSFEDNIVLVKDEETIPYSSIGLDNESIISFVSLIDDIKSWIEFFKNVQYTDKDTLSSLLEELKKWFCHPSLSQIDKRYKKVEDLINYWIDKEIKAPINTLLFLLLDVSKVNSISYREPFTTGVTFVEFNENITYSQKFVFFINCGSNVLPSKNIKSELDLGTTIDLSKKEKEAFLYQIQNGGRVFFSFIGMDLKKDAELFESTFSKELRQKLIIQRNPQGPEESDKDYNKRISELVAKEVTPHTIDETRAWSELYTRGERNKKDYREGLLSIKQPQAPAASASSSIQDEQEIRARVSLGDLAKLLEEPLSARAKYLFGSEDDSNEKNHQEFEPFSLNALENYFIVSALAEKRARHALSGQKEKYNNAEFEKQLRLENRIPHLNSDIESLSFEIECEKTQGLLESIGIEGNPADYEILRLDDLILNCNGQDWVLTCNKNIIRKEAGNVINYYEFKLDSKNKRIKFLYLYVASLMDVALRNDTIEYTINLHRYDACSYTLNSQESIEILNDLFELLNKYDDPYFAYLDFVKKKVKSFNKLVEYIDEDNGPWGRFPYSKLFDRDTEIGYSRSKYKESDYYDNQNKIIEDIKYVEPQAPNPDDLDEDDE